MTLEDAVHATRPDVAIVDIRMPPDHTDDGARVARRLRSACPDLGILVLSQHVETHVASILGKLDLASGEEDHRRVLAVVAYLRDA
jgi:DNA-binding NarL/FixJ family response regulator